MKLRTRKDGHSFQPPTDADLIREYNRMAVETLLFNSSEIVFSFSSLPGVLVKRIGFLSKVLHVPYDLEYECVGRGTLAFIWSSRSFWGPTKYGESLAALTFKTLH